MTFSFMLTQSQFTSNMKTYYVILKNKLTRVSSEKLYDSGNIKYINW